MLSVGNLLSNYIVQGGITKEMATEVSREWHNAFSDMAAFCPGEGWLSEICNRDWDITERI